MSLKIRTRVKPKLPPVAPGVYIAVCVGVIDLGEQYSEKFKNYRNEIQLIWDLPGETVEVDGERKPRQLSRTFGISASKKSALRNFISSWTGTQYSDEQFQDLDLFSLAGRSCQLNVVLSDSGEYANVDGAIPLPKGMPAPTTKTAPILFSLDEWNDQAFAALPEWTREKIVSSTQYQQHHAPAQTIDFPAPAADLPGSAPNQPMPDSHPPQGSSGTGEECPF